MSPRRRTLALVAVTAVLATVAAGSVLQFTAPTENVAGLTTGDRLAPLTFALFALVAGVVARRRPDLVIGWILLSFAGLMALNGTAAAVVYHGRAETVLVDVAAWLSAWSFLPAISALGIALLVFPDGRLPSARWRHLLRLQWVGVGLAGALAAALWPHRGRDLLDVDGRWPGVAGRIGSLLLPIVFLGFLTALSSLIARYRSGSTVVRLQLKWLVLAVTLLVLALLGSAIADATGNDQQGVQDVLGISGLSFLPIAIGLAILRYRLFEIDRIIRRTVSFAILTVLLVAIYAVGVLGVGALLPDSNSDLLVAGSTLAVAALFQPLRSRIQLMVERRFNRARYDAARTVAAFSARLRHEIDIDALREDLLSTARTSLEPGVSGLWLPAP